MLAIIAAVALERILLPVVIRQPVEGAFGSRWETVLTIRNASDEPLVYFPADCPVMPPVPEKFCLQNIRPTIPPNTTMRIDPLNGGPLFFNVEKPLLDRTFLQLRVRDTSRAAESFGTEIPVVRVADMLTRDGQILDIPQDPRFRLMFRLYTDIVSVRSQIRVRFVNERSDRNQELVFTIPPHPGTGPGGPEAITSPGLYREIAIQNAGTIRIEIEPLDADVRYWAFVSVTNNDTQQITTLTVH
jgi:hypothetical protein